MIKTIDTAGLRQLIQSKSDFLLLDVLSKEAFAKDHIEGAKNIPSDSSDFATAVERAASSKTKKVVVYCSGTACNASDKAAERLVSSGHTNVFTYKGGLEAWRQTPEHTASGEAHAQKTEKIAHDVANQLGSTSGQSNAGGKNAPKGNHNKEAAAPSHGDKQRAKGTTS